MQTLYKLPLLDPESETGFQCVELSADVDSKSNWSVCSYVLRGGLQEGVQVVEVDNGKLAFAILPTRGMGIWKAECGDVTMGWDSPVKDPVNPAFINLQDRGGIGWLKGFNEWFVRCGLNSIGASGIDRVLDNCGNKKEEPLTLHGNIANIPARAVLLEVTDEAIIVRGEVDETRMFGPAFRLNTEIRTEFGSNAMTITDTVINLGNRPEEHQLLYHINYGEPLLEKGSHMLTPYKNVAPRDVHSAKDMGTFSDYGSPQSGFAEQVYYYEQVGKRGSKETLAMLCNAARDQASVIRYSLNDFPYFIQWKNTAAKADGYVTGMEPATAYPNLRQFERENGRVITLEGGESRTTRITIEALDTKKAVSAATAEIRKLQKTVKGKVHSKPLARLSG